MMTSCDETRDHLEACEDCRLHVVVEARMRTLPVLEPPKGLVARAMKALPRVAPVKREFFRLATAAAMLDRDGDAMGALSAIVLSIWRLRDVQGAEWLTIPFAFLFAIIDAWKGSTAINDRFLGGSAVVEEKPTDSPAWGITLVGLGLVFLAHNLGWLDLDKLARFWPLLLIGAGAFFIYGSIRKRKAGESVDGGSSL